MLNNILKNRKLRYSLVSLLAVVLIGGAVTLAYLSKSTEAATNNFAPGEVTTKIEEETEVKGTIIEKNPVVVNTGESACIVRMRVTISPSSIANLVGKENGVTIDYNKDKWTYNEKDGFWYYQSILPSTDPDTRTVPLFTKIIGITDDTGKVLEKFKDLEDFQITLYQEAVQTEVTIDGKPVKATDATGNYNSENAKRIWKEYDKKQTAN